MAIYRIKKDYCTENKVQIMLANASSHMIATQDNIAYLRYRTDTCLSVNINKYLDDDDRLTLPYHDVPITDNHINQLFEFDKIYVRATNNPYIKRGSAYEPYDGFSLSFMLFERQGNGDAVLEERGLTSFNSAKHERFTDKNGVKEYLGRLKEDGKYIFNYRSGVRYACSEQTGTLIDRFSICLDDDDVVKEYNRTEEPLIISAFFVSQEAYQDKLNDTSWKKEKASDITDYSLTSPGINLCSNYPIVISIKNGVVTASEFEIFYISTNNFKIKETKRTIKVNDFSINNCVSDIWDADYTSDPTDLSTKFKLNHTFKYATGMEERKREKALELKAKDDEPSLELIPQEDNKDSCLIKRIKRRLTRS